MFDNAKFGYSYCDNGAVEGTILFNLALGTLIYILCKATNEYSWVDRIWTILPIAYALHFIVHPLYCDDGDLQIRKLMMTILVCFWGIRLSSNYWRKGGFKKGGEDHRWPYMRNKWGGFRMELLLFFFVSYYQLFLILWFTLPVYYVSSRDFDWKDGVLLMVALSLLMLEKLADDQQWQFQKAKHAEIKSGVKEPSSVFKAGFITTGLFKYSRHPNFFAEISFWWMIALFSFKDIGLNLSLLGAVQLTLLFQGSTRLTEYISAQKYPLYKTYQKNVSMLIPMPSAIDVLNQKSQ